MKVSCLLSLITFVVKYLKQQIAETLLANQKQRKNLQSEFENADQKRRVQLIVCETYEKQLLQVRASVAAVRPAVAAVIDTQEKKAARVVQSPEKSPQKKKTIKVQEFKFETEKRAEIHAQRSPSPEQRN